MKAIVALKIHVEMQAYCLRIWTHYLILGYITFDQEGRVITSSKLDKDVATYVKQFKLDSHVYTPKRKEYMDYHRANVFQS